MKTEIHGVTIAVIECGECGVTFGMTTTYQKARREDHRTFYCPNGHLRHYPADNEAEQLRKQLDDANERAARETARVVAAQDQAAAAERSAKAYKGQATKIRRRVLRGVCPFCNRSFENVANHMQSKHADKLDEQDVHGH